MDYTLSGRTYSLSYSELREEYISLCEVSDWAFMELLPRALHLAVIICWLKERGNAVLGDDGIVHRLVHLIANPEDEDLKDVRKQFEQDLKLSA